MVNSKTNIDSEKTVDLVQTVDLWKTIIIPQCSAVQLVLLSGQSNEISDSHHAVIAGETMAVGRAVSADFHVPTDDRMSKMHFSLECRSDTGILHDLGSTNGTYVNGLKVKRIKVADGDLIVAGNSAFKVHVAYESTV